MKRDWDSKPMQYAEARVLIECVIDTLMEVGNGTTPEELHTAADQLLLFRDKYLNLVEDRCCEGSMYDR